jgi:hypothetical protein
MPVNWRWRKAALYDMARVMLGQFALFGDPISNRAARGAGERMTGEPTFSL